MNVKAEELIKQREDLGLTREQLAKELKTTYTTVYRWETANRSIPAHLELALESVQRKFGGKKKDELLKIQ